MMQPDPDRDTVEIHGLASGGDGVGKGSDGRTLFVPLTAPGDRVGVRIVRKRKRYGHAVLEAIERAAPERVTPGCALFGLCGGCDWQHLAYEQQARWKGQIVQQTLQRVGKIERDVPPIHPAPQPYGTRSRARLPISEDRRPGFFRRGSHEIVEVAHCPVLTAPLNALLSMLFAQLPACPFPASHVRVLGEEGALALSLHASRDEAAPAPADERLREWSEGLAAALAAQAREPAAAGSPAQPLALRGVSWWHGRKQLGAWGEPWVWHGAIATPYRPEGFAQASFACNQQLIDRAVAMVAPAPGDPIVELYAGRGNLSLPLARAGARVLALDSDEQALTDGRTAAKEAGLQGQVTFGYFHDQKRAAGGSLTALFREHGFPAPRKLLVDPPRQGLSAAICDEIIALAPAQLVYVSCDPATLARDLKALCAAGYALEQMEVVDLIPQTAHVETLASLRLVR